MCLPVIEIFSVWLGKRLNTTDYCEKRLGFIVPNVRGDGV